MKLRNAGTRQGNNTLSICICLRSMTSCVRDVCTANKLEAHRCEMFHSPLPISPGITTESHSAPPAAGSARRHPFNLLSWPRLTWACSHTSSSVDIKTNTTKREKRTNYGNSQWLAVDILVTAIPPPPLSLLSSQAISHRQWWKAAIIKRGSVKELWGEQGLLKWDHLVFCWKYKEVCIIMLFLGGRVQSDCSTHH